MGRRIQPVQHERLFIGAEGKSEVAFVQWLQRLCRNAGVLAVLDAHDLRGGSPQAIMEAADRKRRLGAEKGAYARACILMDADLISEVGVEDRLRRQAKGLHLVIQRPNHEGLLLRLIAGEERGWFEETPKRIKARLEEKRPRIWDGNRKRALTVEELESLFTLADLHRAATHDPDLRRLLEIVGLWPPPTDPPA